MTDEPNPILALIDKAVEEKTFSLEALTSIQKIKEQAEKLDRELKTARSSHESTKSELYREQSARRAAEEATKKWEQREKDLVAREAKMFELEKQQAVSAAEAHAYSSIVGLMFANRVVRETVLQNSTRPVAMPGQTYPTQASETGSVTTTRQEE